MKTSMKTTMFVAALAAMILGQASVSAADSTPAILKSVKAKQTLNKDQMKKVKGEWYAYNYAYLGYGKYNLGYLGYNKYNLGYLGYNKYNLGYLGYGKYNLGLYGYGKYNLGFYGNYCWH